MPVQKFVQNFLNKFTQDETTTLAASLAYYTALSMAPLLILFVTIASQFSPELQRDFVTQTQSVVGEEGAAAVKMVIDGAKDRPDLTSVASIFGVVTLLLSASLIFGELRAALNRIFGVRPKQDTAPGWFGTVFNTVKAKVLQMGLVLCTIMLLIASLIASSVISGTAATDFKEWAWMINLIVSFIFYIGLFTIMFRYLPDRRQGWECAIRGGALTAFLFVIGKEVLGIYLGRSAIGSAYGAAGSLIVLLVWVYYSSLITFIGAQVSSILMPHSSQRSPA